jgi:hypothetical protein
MKDLVYGSSIDGVVCGIATLEPTSGFADRDGRVLGPIALDELGEGVDVLGVFCMRES